MSIALHSEMVQVLVPIYHRKKALGLWLLVLFGRMENPVPTGDVLEVVRMGPKS